MPERIYLSEETIMQEDTFTYDFKQSLSILKSTGKKARTLRELRDLIASVSAECIYHHVCEYFLKGHILEYTNDFAQWAGEGLEERALSERLSNIDPYTSPDTETLRKELLAVIDDYLAHFPEPRQAMPGGEFFFNETITIVFSAGIHVKNLAEFLMAIKYLDANSLYYHFYDARVRLGGRMNDFSKWFIDALEKRELAEKIMSIDPYVHSIEGIRDHIAEAVDEELKKDMETSGVAA